MNRRATILLAIAYFFAFGSVGVQMPLAAPALLGLGFSAAVVGNMWAARSAMQVFAPALFGAAADRVGSGRPFAALSLFLGALAFLFVPFVESVGAGVALFALYGLVGTASVSLLDGMVLTALGSEKRRYGSVRLFGAVGFGVCALGSSVLIERGLLVVRAEAVFPLAALLSFLAALVVLRVPRLQRPRMTRLCDLASAAREGGLLPLALLGLLHWASHGAYTALVTPLVEARGGTAGAVGLALTLGIAVEVLMMRASGALMGRFGPRRVLLAVATLTLSRWLLLAVTEGAASFVVVSALHGVSFGLFYPTLVTLLAERVPAHVRQGAQGLFSSTFFGVGGALGMSAAGAVFERFGERATWLAMAAFSAGALAVAVVAERPQRAARR